MGMITIREVRREIERSNGYTKRFSDTYFLYFDLNDDKMYQVFTDAGDMVEGRHLWLAQNCDDCRSEIYCYDR